MAERNWENYYWWKGKDSDIYKKVWQYVAFLRRNQDYRHTGNFKYLRLYSNYDVLDLQTYSYVRDETTAAIQNRVTFNVIQSMVDTVTSKITKNEPKASFLTEGGDFILQQRARKLSKFIEGQFYATEYHEKAALAFRDSCIFGTGAVKIFNRGSRMEAERVFIDEIIVDDSESFYGKPRQMHQTKWIHKEVLKEMFPNKKNEIENVGSSSANQNSYDSPYNRNPDMVWTIESWHIPSSESATDGKHAISIRNTTLFSEEWKKPYFPFVFYRWNERTIGFYGQGLAEQLQGIQLEINKILRTIQVSMHLVSIPKIYLEASSKIVTSHLDNKIGGIIKYAGQPPTNGALAEIPAQLFTHLDYLYNRAYDIAGVSQLSATSQKPAGLDSGKALREYNDIETERFMEVAKRYENTSLTAAGIYTAEMRSIVEENKKNKEEGEEPKVTVKGEDFIETIKWSEVDLDEDKYQMHVFPTSSLSSTPAGRLQDVQELLQAGMIDPREGRDLLNFPDLQGYYNTANAPIEDIKYTITEIVEKGNYQSPEPYQDLAYGIVKVQESYLFYRTQKLSENRLELLRRWIEEAQVLLKKAQQAEKVDAAETASPPGPEMPPPGAEMPLPEEAGLPPQEVALPAPGEVPMPAAAVPGGENLPQ